MQSIAFVNRDFYSFFFGKMLLFLRTGNSEVFVYYSQGGIMKLFLIIFIVWLLLFLFCWAMVHGAKLHRERLGLFEDDIQDHT